MKVEDAVEFIRKGSRGIQGTYENIDHHAKAVRRIVEVLEIQVTEAVRRDCVKKWKQGHNVHILITHDGRQITFRPFRARDGSGIAGVEVMLRIRRKEEVRIALIQNIVEAVHFGTFLPILLASRENFYGRGDDETKSAQ